MKIVNCTFLCLLFSMHLSAQVLDTARVITYGGSGDEEARQVICTSDSGFLVVGSTSSLGAGNSDIYVIKLTKDYQKEWSHVYGSQHIEKGNAVAEIPGQGYVIAGTTNARAAFGYDILLLKIDYAGMQLWSFAFGGTDWEFGTAVQLTAAGNIVAGGYGYSDSYGGSDGLLVSVDTSGNLAWMKHYGGAGDDSFSAVKEDFSGNLICWGTITSFGNGGNDFFLVRCNASGDSTWSQTYGSAANETGYAIDFSLDSNYLVIGTSDEFLSALNTEVLLMKIDRNGSIQWQQHQGGVAEEDGFMIKQLPNGEIISGGMTKSFGWGGKAFLMIRNDSAGNFITGASFGWDKDDEGYSCAIGFDNSIVFAGKTNSYGFGLNDVYLVVIDTFAIENDYILNVVQLNDAPIGIFSNEFFAPSLLSLYPNPASDLFHIRRGDNFPFPVKAEFFDAGGRLFGQHWLLPGINSIQRNNLPAGFYIISVSYPTGEVFQSKLALH